MRKTLIYANDSKESQEIKRQLLEKMAAHNLPIVTETGQPDYIVTIGGDGTLLSAFHRFQSMLNDVEFIGIHTGHLGFYTDWLADEIDEVVSSILNYKAASISYPLLRIYVQLEDDTVKQYLALNEFTIRSAARTIVCDVSIKEHFFETFRGDGLCIATPTGSTGLNKSLGGAIIHPRLDAIQMTEMASVNNRVYRTLSSPIVIPSDEWFILQPADDQISLIVTIDNLYFEDVPVKEVHLQLAEERLHFASFRHMHYWDRVESSFIGRKRNYKSNHTAFKLRPFEEG